MSPEETVAVQLVDHERPVKVHDIERDDDVALIGKNKSDKRFVARRDSVGDFDASVSDRPQERHRFRLYLTNGSLLRVTGPSFEAVEAWYLNESGEANESLTFCKEGDKRLFPMHRDQISTILSAMPSDDAKYGNAPAASDDDEDDSPDE